MSNSKRKNETPIKLLSDDAGPSSCESESKKIKVEALQVSLPVLNAQQAISNCAGNQANYQLPHSGQWGQIPVFDRLSNDVVSIIFKHLDLADIHLRSALVSKRWSAIARAKCFEPTKWIIRARDTPNEVWTKCYFWEKYERSITTVLIIDNNRENNADIKRYPEFRLRLCDTICPLMRRSEVLKELILDQIEWGELLRILNSARNNVEILKLQFDREDLYNETRLKALLKQILFLVSQSKVVDLKLIFNVRTMPMFSYDYVVPSILKKLKFTAHRTRGKNFAKLFVESNKNTLTRLELRCRFDDELAIKVSECENLQYFSLVTKDAADAQFYGYLPALKCPTIKLATTLAYYGTINFANWRFMKNATILDFQLKGCNFPWFLDYDFPLVKELRLRNYNTTETVLKLTSKFPLLETLILGIVKKTLRIGLVSRVMQGYPNVKKLMIAFDEGQLDESLFSKLRDAKTLKDFKCRKLIEETTEYDLKYIVVERK